MCCIFQSEAIHSSVVHQSNPAGPQIYPSDYSQHGNAEIGDQTLYAQSPPSIISFANQGGYQQHQSYYTPNASHGEVNLEIDPPTYDEATGTNIRNDSAWKF